MNDNNNDKEEVYSICGGLEFRVYQRHGGWCYSYSDWDMVDIESPMFPNRIKPSIRHFQKWIVSTIKKEA